MAGGGSLRVARRPSAALGARPDRRSSGKGQSGSQTCVLSARVIIPRQRRCGAILGDGSTPHHTICRVCAGRHCHGDNRPMTRTRADRVALVKRKDIRRRLRCPGLWACDCAIGCKVLEHITEAVRNVKWVEPYPSSRRRPGSLATGSKDLAPRGQRSRVKPGTTASPLPCGRGIRRLAAAAG